MLLNFCNFLSYFFCTKIFKVSKENEREPDIVGALPLELDDRGFSLRSDLSKLCKLEHSEVCF